MWRSEPAYLSRHIGADAEIPIATRNQTLRAQEQVPGGQATPQNKRKVESFVRALFIFEGAGAAQPRWAQERPSAL